MANKIALQAVDFALHDRPQASIELGFNGRKFL